MKLVDAPATPSPRRNLWPMLVVGLLTMQVVLCGVAMTLAGADASFAVEPDYHRKALHWDDEAAARAASAKLGWRVAVRLDGGHAVLALCDREGAPVSGATVAGEYFHHARAAARREFRATEADGDYHADVRIDRAGLWEFRVRADRGGERFECAQTLEIGASGAVLP